MLTKRRKQSQEQYAMKNELSQNKCSLKIKNRITEVKNSINKMEGEVIVHKADQKEIKENRGKNKKKRPVLMSNMQTTGVPKQENKEKWSRGNQKK